jgi:hypothetical protein
MSAEVVLRRLQGRGEGSSGHRGRQTRRSTPIDRRKEHHDGRRPEHDCADVVEGVLAGEDDFLREAVTLVADLMEAESIFGFAGSGPIGSLPRSRVVALSVV